MLESAAKNPKLVSPTTHESPSTLPLPLPVLPEELISYILLRLPVRSLIQFSCVSKSWKTLISNPQFAKDHLRNSTQQRLMTFFCASKALSFSLHSLFQNPPNPLEGQRLTMKGSYNILGFCNGLLCLSDVLDGNVLLWNPSTRTASKRFALDVGTVRHNNYGFGYDHLIDKYKLVVVARTIQETVTKIYTFGADSWTVLPTSTRYPIYWLGKFVGGTLNWLAKGGASDDQWVILSLDFGTEMFSEMSLPVGDGDNVCSPLLKVLDDRVYVCFFDSKNTHVWLMKEYGVQESWTKLMIIPHLIEGSSGLLSVIHLCFDLLCVSEDGVVLFKTTLGKLVRYNSNDGRFDYPRIRGKLRGHCLIYHESLVSPEC